jgi:hypothetical protein
MDNHSVKKNFGLLTPYGGRNLGDGAIQEALFVRQVLTFTRVDNVSLTGKIRDFFPYLLHAFICLKKYGQVYLTAEE